MTYEYACTACGHEWEAEQSIRDQPIRKCPKCHKLQAKRQISRGAGFILKGGGWYADGYGSSGGSKGKSGDDSPSTSTVPSSGSGGDDKGSKKASGSGEAKGKTQAA